MNHKGTLRVRQCKDHVRMKILDDSSYFRVRKAFMNCRVSLQFIKGLVNYTYLQRSYGPFTIPYACYELVNMRNLRGLLRIVKTLYDS